MMTLIIVEDEYIIREGLRQTIDWAAYGCRLLGVAKNGEEGLDLIIKEHPDLVIADIKMPKLNGLEMIEKAKVFYNFDVIFLTSYSEFEYAKKAIELQCVQYLLKPLDEKQLKKAILLIQNRKSSNNKIEIVKNNFNTQLNKINVDISDLYLIKMISIIKKEYNKKITLLSIAKRLNISKSYLSRKLNEELNVSFSELINLCKIDKAMELLALNEYRVFEIAEIVGFNDYKYFCSVFKKYTDMTPTEYQMNSK